MWTEQSRTLLVNRPDGPFVGYRCPDQAIDVFHRLDLRFDNAHLTFTIPLQTLSSSGPKTIYNTVVLERRRDSIRRTLRFAAAAWLRRPCACRLRSPKELWS